MIKARLVLWLPTAELSVIFSCQESATIRQEIRRFYDVNSVFNTYTHNGLNQLTESKEGAANSIYYGYDHNGNRISKTQGVNTTTHKYDFDNRMISVTAGGVTYEYIYDYRTRRVERKEGTLTTKVVFSGGTSVLEFDGAAATPTVEFVRGSGMGGGIGSILYSVRAGVPSFTHYNSRGDVVSKTDDAGAVTYQAEYVAFGKHPNEVGATLDRQKANTKEEDPTGLLNEGMRYRDLETGVFLTRDPVGMMDGPNLYYVRQNPWSKFDILGLTEKEVEKTEKILSDKELAKETINNRINLKRVPKSILIEEYKEAKPGDLAADPYGQVLKWRTIEGSAQVETYIRNRIAEDLYILGTEGGEIGFAMINRLLNGQGPLDVVLTDWITHANRNENRIGLNPEARNWHRNQSGFDRKVGITTQTAQGPKGGATVIGHELGHLWMKLTDPFNVQHVENPIRESMGFNRRGIYSESKLGLYRDTSNQGFWDKIFNPQGDLVGDIINHEMKDQQVPASTWLSFDSRSEIRVNDFLKRWGK